MFTALSTHAADSNAMSCARVKPGGWNPGRTDLLATGFALAEGCVR